MLRFCVCAEAAPMPAAKTNAPRMTTIADVPPTLARRAIARHGAGGPDWRFLCHSRRQVASRLLGRLEVDANGFALTPVRPKQRALLALLLLRVSAVVATDDLVEGLWGLDPPETAQTALHGHIS